MTDLTAQQLEELERDLITDIIALSNYSDDPMWANHAEVSKAWLKRWLAKLNALPSLIEEVKRLQRENAASETVAHQFQDLVDRQNDDIADLRRQLAERDAENERLAKRIWPNGA